MLPLFFKFKFCKPFYIQCFVAKAKACNPETAGQFINESKSKSRNIKSNLERCCFLYVSTYRCCKIATNKYLLVLTRQILAVSIVVYGNSWIELKIFNMNKAIGKDISSNYLKSNSQGFMPVCFLKAVLKWEIDEYPNSIETSVTLKPLSYSRYFACSIRWLW